jgi:hypothetical protein
MKNIRFAFFGLLLVLSSCADPVPPEIEAEMAKLPDKVDYSLHVKPLLSDRCFACHGPDKNKQQAGLRLDIKEIAYERNKESGKRAIVPGSLSKSELYNRIISADPEYTMPTPESHLSLSNEEKALLVKWIQQGAEYKEHWAFIKPAKTNLPEVKNKTWGKNEIDRFTLAKMEKKGLNPSPEADKATLLRRISFDLTGLPPSPGEIDAFLQDKSHDAYEKAVDRLLQSPHYGERMAAEWLDVARYADSHGYQDDGMRNVFPYRDWVIRAFNENLSWDKFTTWQLAGDLLPNPTRDQLIATCFNRNHSQSQEGGIIDEEYRTEYVADRTNTFGKAFLGLTMECARCHDHKYDPISQKDYYSMFAFFNQNKESGEVPYNGEASPSLMLPSKETTEQLKFIREKIAPLEQKLNPEQQIYKKGFDNWLLEIENKKTDIQTLQNGLLLHLNFETGNDSTYINTAKTDLKPYPVGDKDRRPLLVNGRFGKARQLRGDCGIDVISKIDEKAKKTEERYYQGLNFERNQPFSLSVWFNILKKGIKGPLVNKNNGEFEGFRGYDISLNADGTLTILFSYVYPANCIELRTTEKLQPNQWTNIILTYDGSAKAKGIKLFLNRKESVTRLVTDNLTKSILHGPHNTNWNYMPFEVGKNVRETIDNLQVDELRVYNRRLSYLEISALADNSTDLQNYRVKADKKVLYEFYLWNFDRDFAAGQKEISRLRLEETNVLTDIPEVMVMQELPVSQSRKTFILSRGAYDASTKTEVKAATPEKLSGFDSKKFPQNRLGLALWLNDSENPLAARVAVNRFWMMIFGRGIVKTQEDWGNQGDLPTHPELLDWLAVSFRESGWNVKTLLKKIVMSATYRQTSIADARHQEIDPDNLLLSRGSSYRLSSEQIRDNALAASGLLARKIGGQSVYPYQPAGLWEALATRNKVHYEQGHGEDLYRRSLYTVWKRSSPPPSMMTFDVPDRYFCTVRRQKTSTPLQALILMNDPQYTEAARVLAERMIKEGGMDINKRIELAYKALVSRYPRQKELDLLKKMYAEELSRLQKNPQRVKELLNTGEYPRDNLLNSSEVAACSIIAMTLLNFEETVMKR